ncbi:MAG TPA: hypothetical protein PLY94_05660 [Gemmatimonadaceae bacterium]|nr:hypothetical protein [Gemmatimonadaceae bacterium]
MRILAALPDFAIAIAALITWVAPSILGEHWAGYFLTLMLLEFIVVHSAAFLGSVAFSDSPRSKRVMLTLGLAGFYTLFGAAIAFGAKAWWPLFAFWGLIVNRLLGILFGTVPSGREREAMQASWVVGAISYLLGAFATVLLPVPRLGVRPEMLGPIGEDSGGLWADEPQRVLAFAVLYFTVVGLHAAFGGRAVAQRA